MILFSDFSGSLDMYCAMDFKCFLKIIFRSYLIMNPKFFPDFPTPGTQMEFIVLIRIIVIHENHAKTFHGISLLISLEQQTRTLSFERIPLPTSSFLQGSIQPVPLNSKDSFHSTDVIQNKIVNTTL